VSKLIVVAVRNLLFKPAGHETCLEERPWGGNRSATPVHTRFVIVRPLIHGSISLSENISRHLQVSWAIDQRNCFADITRMIDFGQCLKRASAFPMQDGSITKSASRTMRWIRSVKMEPSPGVKPNAICRFASNHYG
jgi:hypothetical protein